jgi:hypothetical protein
MILRPLVWLATGAAIALVCPRVILVAGPGRPHQTVLLSQPFPSASSMPA